jgi:hypothetical protein
MLRQQACKERNEENEKQTYPVLWLVERSGI